MKPSALYLQRCPGSASAGWTLGSASFPTDPGSPGRFRFQAWFGASHLIIQSLHTLHERGWDAVQLGAVPSIPVDPDGSTAPSELDLGRWIAPLLARKGITTVRRLISRTGKVPHWQIAVRVGRGNQKLEDLDTDDFTWIEAPVGHFYADTFLFPWHGRTYLFFEDYSYAVGHAVISCCEIGPDGALGPVEVVLTSSGHLSYPYVFAHDDEVFMIPESGAESVVRLFRAKRFPTEWEPVCVLYGGAAVDTSVVRRDGRWWFFTTLIEPRGQAAMLTLFTADSLTDPWVPHPANPISMDARNARGAGSILLDASGRLIRPTVKHIRW